MEIYLVWEKLSQNKENYMSNSEQKFGKDRQGKIKIIPQTTTEKPLHYKNPKESLFYKQRMVKVKTTVRLGGKEKQMKMWTERQWRGGWQDHKVGGKINKGG